MRECDIIKLNECDIAYIKKLPGLPAYTADDSQDTFEERYTVVIGGANPCECGDTYWANAYSYVPPGGSEYDALPTRGDQVNRNGKLYYVTSVKTKEARDHANAGRCRKVCVVVTYTWAEVILNLGRPRLAEADVPTYPCRLKFSFGNESVPTELAEYQGFYDYKGAVYNPTFETNDSVCTPFDGINKGTLLPVTNAAGVPPDSPLTKDQNQTRVMFSRPYFQVNGNFADTIKNCINCDEFFLLEFRGGIPTRGMRVKPYTARVTGVQMADDYTIDTGKYFTWVTIELTIRKNIIKYVEDNLSITESEDFGWDELMLNAGHAYLRYPGMRGLNGDIVEADKFPALTGGTVEQIVDKNGSLLPEPTLLNENGITWKMHRETLPGGVDDLKNGAVCTAGRMKEDILYIRWGKYKVVQFASANTFPGFMNDGLWPATQGNGLPIEHFPNWASSGDLSGTILDDYSPDVCP